MVAGSTSAAHASAEFTEASLIEYPTYVDCVRALRTGKVSGVVSDAAILSGFAAQQPDRFVITALDQTSDGGDRVERAGDPQRYGIGLPPEDTASVSMVNAALDELIRSGTWQTFADKHLADTALAWPGEPGQAGPA